MISLLTKIIRTFEGMAKMVAGLVYPYICPAGYPTQGIGLLVKDMSVPPITPEEAERRLQNVLPYYINETFKLSPGLVNAPPECQAAIVDFVFNLGVTAYRASTLRKRVNEGDWPAACSELMRWVNGGGKKLPGLIARRTAESLLIKKVT